jgi:hypothetical protein
MILIAFIWIITLGIVIWGNIEEPSLVATLVLLLGAVGITALTLRHPGSPYVRAAKTKGRQP